MYTIDCNGDCDGGAALDDCGVCYGGRTGVAISSTLDICGNCTTKPNYSPGFDCNNECNGTAAMDECTGQCTGKCLLEMESSSISYKAVPTKNTSRK